MQMKTAAVISTSLHAAVLLWAAVSFSGKTLEAKPVESLPIDFISEKDFSQMTKGAKDAPKPDKPMPFVERKAEEPKPVEEHKIQVSDKPDIKLTAEQPPQTPSETKPVKQEKSEPHEAKAALPKRPEPVVKDKNDPIAEKLQKSDDKKLAKVIPQTSSRQPTPQHKEQPKFDATKIAALLDQRDPRRQAAAGNILNPDTTLGHVKGTAAQLSQSEIDAFRARVEQCWQPPLGAENADLEVVFRVRFNLDGTVKSGPDVVEGPPSALGPVFAESARRAILQCQPYTMLRREHYEQWKDMEAAFNLREMLR